MTKIIRELRNTEGNRICAIRKEREARSLKEGKEPAGVGQEAWERAVGEGNK